MEKNAPTPDAFAGFDTADTADTAATAQAEARCVLRQPSTEPALRAELAELRARLEEAEETLRAIRAGEVDALVVDGDAGPQIFTLQGLDAEQNRFRGEMLAQVSDAVVAMDLEDRITFLNAAAERQYGVRAGDVLGRSFNEICTPQWPGPEVEAGLRTALGEHGEWRGELVHRTHDGRELHVEKVVATLRGPGGKRTGRIAAIRDVTGRKQLERENAEALRLLDTLLTHAPVGFVFLDRDLRFVRINERLAEINGFSIAAHVGKPMAEILPSLEPTLREVTAHILATGQPVLDHEFSGETAHAPGITRHWKESWYPVRDERGEIIGFGGVVDEITERKRAEEALRHNERRFRGIFDSAFQFIGLMTPDGTVLEANRTALEAGGLRAENVIGKPFWDCDWWTLTERTGRELRTAIGRAASGELVRYDVDVRGAEGRVITIDLSIKPVRDEAGRVVLLIPEGRDITCLKRAEENLRLTNQRFALAVKCSQMILCQQDLDLRYTWLHNPASGIDGSDAVGKKDEDLLERAEDAAVIVALKREVIRSGIGLRKEFSPRIQGVVHCFEVLVEPLRDAGGRITGITGAAIDITQLKRAEEARHQVERNYRALAVASSEVSYQMSADWSTMLPLDGRELVASSDHPLADWAWLDQNIPLDEHPRVRLAIHDAIARKSLFELEHRVRRPDGSIGWTLSRAMPILDENDHVIGWFGAAGDITERKRAEEAWHANEERMRLATTATGVGIWEWNLVTGLVRWDAQMFRLYGMAPTTDGFVAYDAWCRSLLPEDLARQEEMLADTVRRLGKGTREFRILRADNRECRWIQAVETVRTNEEGQAEWVVGTNLDVTARTNAEHAIREEAQRKDEFLAMLGHELRNPLNAIRHAVQIGLEMPQNRDACQSAASVIDRQSQQLSRMVDDLLDVARINRGRVELRVQALDLGPVLEQAIAAMRPLFASRGQIFTSDIGSQLRVTGDAPRLEQVFVNLLTNAAKYTPDNGRISLRAWHQDGEVVVAITDDGAGISPELLPRIFDLFRQAESTLDRALGGLGIGLNVVKSLVEMHFGRVTVESAGTNAGTTATVSLRALLEWPAAESPPAAPLDAAPPKPLRVLIVDDHIDAAESLELLLQLRGCEARSANSGPAGVAAAREFRPDVLLLDLGLPGFDGYEVARILRAEAPFADALFIAISGYAQDSDRQRTLSSGFDYHFPKPFDLSEVLQAIHSHGSLPRDPRSSFPCAPVLR